MNEVITRADFYAVLIGIVFVASVAAMWSRADNPSEFFVYGVIPFVAYGVYYLWKNPKASG